MQSTKKLTIKIKEVTCTSLGTWKGDLENPAWTILPRPTHTLHINLTFSNSSYAKTEKCWKKGEREGEGEGISSISILVGYEVASDYDVRIAN